MNASAEARGIEGFWVWGEVLRDLSEVVCRFHFLKCICDFPQNEYLHLPQPKVEAQAITDLPAKRLPVPPVDLKKLTEILLYLLQICGGPPSGRALLGLSLSQVTIPRSCQSSQLLGCLLVCTIPSACKRGLFCCS